MSVLTARAAAPQLPSPTLPARFLLELPPFAPRPRLFPGGALDAITNLCKRRGFVFPSAEIYGSIGTAYDLGPLGCQLKKNLQDRWWRDFVERRPDCMGVETATILNPRGARVGG